MIGLYTKDGEDMLEILSIVKEAVNDTALDVYEIEEIPEPIREWIAATATLLLTQIGTGDLNWTFQDPEHVKDLARRVKLLFGK